MLWGYGIEKSQGLEDVAMEQGYIEFGVDTCINDTWIEPQYKVRIMPVDIEMGKKDNWILYNVSWYHNSSIHPIKTDQIYSLYQGVSGVELPEREMSSMFLDLWINKVNASSVVGGRVNAEWFGVAWKNTPWWNIGPDITYLATGKAPWGPKTTDITQSMFFHNLEDISGNIVSIKEIEMVRCWTRVNRTNVGEFHHRVRDIDLFNMKSSPSHTGVQGVDTPIFTDTQMPTMSGGKGFLAAFTAALTNLFVKPVTDALLYGMMNAFTWFISMLDTVSGYFGYPDFASTMLAIVQQFWNFTTTATAYLLPLTTDLFNFFATTFIFVIGMFTRIVTTFINIASIVSNILTGTAVVIGGVSYDVYTGVGNMWDLIALEGWIDAVPLFLWIAWFLSIDNRARRSSKNPLSGWITIFWGDLMMIIAVMSFFFDVFYRIVNFAIDVLFKIIDSIPGI